MTSLTTGGDVLVALSIAVASGKRSKSDLSGPGARLHRRGARHRPLWARVHALVPARWTGWSWQTGRRRYSFSSSTARGHPPQEQRLRDGEAERLHGL
jgi:hypothetical protein